MYTVVAGHPHAKWVCVRVRVCAWLRGVHSDTFDAPPGWAAQSCECWASAPITTEGPCRRGVPGQPPFAGWSDSDALIRQRDITKDAQPRKARLPIAVRAGGSVISAKDVEPAVRSQ